MVQLLILPSKVISVSVFLLIIYLKEAYMNQFNLNSYSQIIEKILEQDFLNISLLSQIAESIQAFHQSNLTHRDIKSKNILIDENDALKVSDLGLVSEVDITNTLEGKASYQWKAPEFFEGIKLKELYLVTRQCSCRNIYEELSNPGFKASAQVIQSLSIQQKYPQFYQEIMQEPDLAQLIQQYFNYDPIKDLILILLNRRQNNQNKIKAYRIAKPSKAYNLNKTLTKANYFGRRKKIKIIFSYINFFDIIGTDQSRFLIREKYKNKSENEDKEQKEEKSI